MSGRGTTASRPDAASVLAELTAAMGDGQVPAIDRVCAAPDPRSPQEGLALLAAYTDIHSATVRQAILDAVVTIAARSPRRSP